MTAEEATRWGWTAVLLGLVGVFVVLATTAPGGLDSGDAFTRLETARSWFEGRGGRIPPDLVQAVPGDVTPPGSFGVFGPLQSVVLLPVVALTLWVGDVGSVPKSILERTSISLVLLPLLGAIMAAAIYSALRTWGFSRRIAALATGATLFGSILWPYFRIAQEENLVATGCATWLLGAARSSRQRAWGATSMSLGLCLLVSARWLAVAPATVLALASCRILWAHRLELRVRDLAIAVALGISVVTCILAYNVYRFGDPFETGYGLAAAQQGVTYFDLSGFWARAAALVASPFRGLVWFSPIVVIASCGLRGAGWRGFEAMKLGIAGAMLATLAVASCFVYWFGGSSWGPRYLAGVQALLALPVAMALRPLRRPGVVVALFVLAQIPAIVLPSQTEDQERARIEEETGVFLSPWRLDGTAPFVRPVRALQAVRATLSGEVGTVVERQFAQSLDPAATLATSDYRTIFWWPFRASIRWRAWSLGTAWLIALSGLGVGISLIAASLRRLARADLEDRICGSSMA